jgi:hypothetical protein
MTNVLTSGLEAALSKYSNRDLTLLGASFSLLSGPSPRVTISPKDRRLFRDLRNLIIAELLRRGVSVGYICDKLDVTDSIVRKVRTAQKESN